MPMFLTASIIFYFTMSVEAVICRFFVSFCLVDLTMGTAAAPQVAPPSWGAPMVNVVCVL